MKKSSGVSSVFSHPEFIGTTVVGERGQVVIPKETRDELHLTAGSKLIVLQHPKGGIILLPANHIREFLASATKHLGEIEKIIKQ